LWDVQLGQEVRDVCFSPGGKYIVTASFGEIARLDSWVKNAVWYF
jgi:hypothetical protein